MDRVIIRLELELTKVGDAAFPVQNLFTGRVAVMPRSRAVRWELVLLKDDVLDADVGNITDITMEVKANGSPETGPLISKSITGAAINVALSDAERQSRSNQHAVINFGQGDTGLSMTGHSDNVKKFWLVITATRNGNLVTLGAGVIEVLNDGGQYSGNTPTAGDPVYYTKEQIDGQQASFLRIKNKPGVMVIMVSENGQWERRWGVTNEGVRIDAVKRLF